MSQIATREASYVLTLEEISSLAQEGGKPAETLMNMVALIARRFQTDVCSVYLLEPDRARIASHYQYCFSFQDLTLRRC